MVYIHIQDLGILGNSGIFGELSAILAEFVLAGITGIAGFWLSAGIAENVESTWFRTYRQSAGIAEMFAGIAENSQILDNTHGLGFVFR